MIFVPLAATYSVLLLVIYRPLTRTAGVRLSRSTTTVETTTATDRSHGESSFVIRQERRFGTTRMGFFLLATVGYITLCVGFAIAFIFVSRSGHT